MIKRFSLSTLAFCIVFFGGMLAVMYGAAQVARETYAEGQ